MRFYSLPCEEQTPHLAQVTISMYRYFLRYIDDTGTDFQRGAVLLHFFFEIHNERKSMHRCFSDPQSAVIASLSPLPCFSCCSCFLRLLVLSLFHTILDPPFSPLLLPPLPHLRHTQTETHRLRYTDRDTQTQTDACEEKSHPTSLRPRHSSSTCLLDM